MSGPLAGPGRTGNDDRPQGAPPVRQARRPSPGQPSRPDALPGADARAAPSSRWPQSQGFNPRPKIVFALALALGIEGRREVVELELAEPMEPAEVLRRLAAVSPPGLDWLEAEAVAPGRRAAGRGGPVRPGRSPPTAATPPDRAWPTFLASDAAGPTPGTGPTATVAIDLRPFVLEAELDPLGVLRFRLKMTPDGSARPEEVIDALGLRDLLGQGAVLVRTEVELAP